MKCMPMTCAGRDVRAAIVVIEMELVFVARIAFAGAMRSSSAKILNLRSAFSVAASMATLAVAAAAMSVFVAMRPSVASRAAVSSVPFFTCRSRFFSIVARPLASATSETSIIVTERPACAHTCAMPLPI